MSCSLCIAVLRPRGPLILILCYSLSTTNEATRRVSVVYFIDEFSPNWRYIVISPNMYNSKLWETSGHWANYKDDMFVLDVEKEKWALKPMNCPGHCMIFDSKDRSYRELPIRMAEFGIIHRNEASGALTGLTRVRRFVQDDTHVFCMNSQVRRLPISGSFICIIICIHRSRKRCMHCLTSCSIYMACLDSNSILNCPRDQTIISEPSKHGMLQKRYCGF
jgi:hypothetical protein